MGGLSSWYILKFAAPFQGAVFFGCKSGGCDRYCGLAAQLISISSPGWGM